MQLNLDPTDFQRGAREAESSYRKLSDNVLKTGKTVETTAKNAAELLTKVTTATLGLLGIFLSARGVTEFALRMATLNSELGRLAANLNMTPQTLSALEMAATRMGGSAAATASSVESWARAIFELNFNGKQLPDSLYRLQALTRVNINTKDATQSILDIATALHKLAEVDLTKAHFIAQDLGFDDATANLMIKQGAALNDYLNSLKKLAPTPQQIAEMTKLQEAFEALKQKAEASGRAILHDFNDPIMQSVTNIGTFIDSIDAIVTHLNELNEASKGWGWLDALNKLVGPKGNGDAMGDLLNWFTTKKPEKGGGRGITLDGGGHKSIELLKAGDDDMRAQHRADDDGMKLHLRGSEVSESNPLPVRIIAATDGGGVGVWDSVKNFFGITAGGRDALGNPRSTGGADPTGAGGGAGGARAIGNWWTQDRMQHAVDRLMKEGGLSREGAAALVARWASVEAPGGPNSVNPRSGALGIAQGLGDRRAGYSGSFDDQISNAIREGKTSEARAWKQLQNAKTAREGSIGASMFERAEGYNSSAGTDWFTNSTAAAAERLLKLLNGDNVLSSKPPSKNLPDIDPNHDPLDPDAGKGDFSGNAARARKAQQLSKLSGAGASAALSNIANDNRTSRSNSVTNSMNIGQVSVNAANAKAEDVGTHVARSLEREWFAIQANYGQA